MISFVRYYRPYTEFQVIYEPFVREFLKGI